MHVLALSSSLFYVRYRELDVHDSSGTLTGLFDDSFALPVCSLCVPCMRVLCGSSGRSVGLFWEVPGGLLGGFCG